MAAPALVLLAHGSTSPLVAEVAHEMRVRMQEMKPEISVHTAFLDHCPPSGPQVISRIARTRTEEVVFVSMNLSATFEPDERVQTMVDKVRGAHPRLRFAVARPVGPEASLLGLVDAKLRSALTSAHVAELDGLVLAAEGAVDQRSQSLLARRARQWSMHHKLPVITANANGTGPGTAAAIAALRAQGRRHVAVGSLFLAPDEAWQAQAEQGQRAGAVAVSEPLGAQQELLEIAWGRYAVAAMGMVDVGLEREQRDTGGTARHLSVVGA